MKNITQSLKVTALALALSVGISYVSAWTAPTVTPPNGNVSAPINVGSTAQTKAGDLTVNKITTPTSCIGADCRTAWPTGGDNLGNHIATQALNMGTNTINSSQPSSAWTLVGTGPVYAPYFMAEGNGLGAPGVGLILISGAGNGKVLTSDANGFGSWQTPVVGGGGPETDPTVLASVKDGVAWSEVSGIPAGFADGVDNVGLAAVPSGTLCGSFVNDTMWGSGWSAFAQCQGMNGWSGCPAGYTFRVTSYDQYSGAANYFYSCIKN